ncbi:MAG: pantetheine-phosphate adenylyltransferase [Candidatus Nitrosotenuis sp.]|uniref:Putative cytidylyltransferase n=1 Tax=Candidatus Nitrosotenuis uzonensis TaxID=1407055 RepID=A0A812F1F2_9ARCH|nr:pantetheine-phosphate adenylyltransferase [Candidatus Nitrosotenuis uzonensis]MCA2003764.1 pantetheine-phosphate adenylyltransferase [Candidatus Nitrosotenuis sp.]CAE6495029.1 putative cytidylyltransferase [Candidatus Nitrosotenuis uzonensis]
MGRYKTVAMGGTFDIIHKGHLALLDAAFLASSHVIIGLTGDELAKAKGKKIFHTYEQRLGSLRSLVEERFPGRSYVISKLENDFGPAAIEGDVDALIVSSETEHQVEVLNRKRAERGLGKVESVVVPMVLAKDGTRISSTRIRNAEIDADGNLT